MSLNSAYMSPFFFSSFSSPLFPPSPSPPPHTHWKNEVVLEAHPLHQAPSPETVKTHLDTLLCDRLIFYTEPASAGGWILWSPEMPPTSTNLLLRELASGWSIISRRQSRQFCYQKSCFLMKTRLNQFTDIPKVSPVDSVQSLAGRQQMFFEVICLWTGTGSSFLRCFVAGRNSLYNFECVENEILVRLKHRLDPKSSF